MNKDGTVTITTTGSQTRTTSLRTLAMMRRCPDLSALQIVQEALKIAGDICIYTNHKLP